MDKGFSFASLILSYFLVGGGMFTGTLIAGQLQLHAQLSGYGFLAGGAFLGGFIAARASRGSTIIEPAIGAIAVVATVVGLAAATPIGKLVWAVAEDQTMMFVGAVGVSGIVGALIGAAVSEKLFGDATLSSVPWLLYTALSAFGASLLFTLLASLVFMTGRAHQLDLGDLILLGIAAGCLLGGLAVGASARTRPLIAAFLGGGVGVAGFCELISRASPHDRDTMQGILILAAGGALITLIGTALGWVAVGRRHAG